MNNLKITRRMISYFINLIGLFIFTASISNGKTMKYPPWLLDSTMKANITIDSVKLKITFTNTGSESRQISSTLFNENYILSNVLSVGLIDPDSPRQKEELFRIFADGVIGVNSEIYKVVPVSIGPNESKSIEIDLISKIYNVENEKLVDYLKKDIVPITLYVSINLNDIGFDSNCIFRYGIPHLKITRNSTNNNIELSITE